MIQIKKQSEDEQRSIYQKCTKFETIEMLIQANKEIDCLSGRLEPMVIHFGGETKMEEKTEEHVHLWKEVGFDDLTITLRCTECGYEYIEDRADWEDSRYWVREYDD